MEEILEQVRASIGGSDRVDLTYDKDSGSVSAPAPVRHAVTLEAGENGSLSADRTQAQSGAVITLTVTPEKGYRLEKLEAGTARTRPWSSPGRRTGPTPLPCRRAL